jgi:N-acetylneuraminic acid mutarotase
MKRFSSAVFGLTFVLVAQPLWAQVQGQWVNTGTMQSGREFNAQVLLTSGNVLSMGGVDNNGIVLNSAEVYNSRLGTWKLTANMTHPRKVFPAVVLTNGKVLVSGGLGVGNTVLASAELYDPNPKSGPQWTSAGFLSVARYGHTATLLPNGKVLVTGGCTSNACSNGTAVSELYDPVANSWSTTGSLNTGRHSHTAVPLKTGVLVIGGSAGTSCELYDYSKGTWSPAKSMNVSHASNATTLLKSGKVLVTGGASGRYPMNSAEIYDPTANTWTLTGKMTAGRYAHTATLLTDGTVLVAGGIGQPISCGKVCTGYIPFAKVDVYNEAAGTFTAAAGLGLLPRALAYHSTTLLGSGRALTAGGSGTSYYCCVVVSNAEVYTPLTFTSSPSGPLDFGLLKVGLTSASQTVTVTNVSSHSRSISSVTPSGDYSQTNTCPIAAKQLNPGQSCTITVTFKPTAAGTRQGAVTLNDNDPGSPSQTIALKGVGETLALGFQPASLNLGTVPVTSTSSLAATLTNDSAAPVNIKLNLISISPADGTFTQTNNCLATLKVQQTCTVTIVFTPPDVFTYNATLSIPNSGNGTAQLPLTGTGADGP